MRNAQWLASAASVLLTLVPCRNVAQTPAQGGAGTEARVDSLLQRMTVDEKIDLLGGDTPFRTRALPRLNIPFFQMADGPVGAHIPAPTIAYAAGIGLAASWDPQLAERVGEQLGRDSRSRGAAFLLGPGVNMYRAPMNGRNFEYFGEDPYLGSRIAVGYIRGVQREGVSATVKHFLGNNSEYLRHDTDSVIDERTLREIYMPIFEAAVKEAHVGAIMDSYNITNGEHMTQNRRLNVDVAKGEWRFPGIIMSDWVSVYDTAAAANGGLDLEMPFGAFFNREKLKPLLADGTVSQATLDDKVRRILRTAVEFGWLDHPVKDLNIPRYNLAGKDVALQGALEGAVLLQNTGGVLPLDRKALHKIAVLGPNAVQTITTGGGSGEVVSFASTNLLTGVSNAVDPATAVLYDRGLYTVDQMARLTQFTTDAEGRTPGVVHETFSRANLEGELLSTVTEPGMFAAGSTRRTPEEQEINALYTHQGSSPYRRSPSSSRWTGYVSAAKSEEFVVFTQTDSRYRLLVDNRVVFDSSVVPKAILNQATLPLTRGAHKVVLELLAGQLGAVSGMRVGVVAEAGIVDPDALAMAEQADAAVVAVGFNNLSEAEGGDRLFELPPGQVQLIREVAKRNKKTIVAITSGGSVDVMPWKDVVQGIFATWYSGEEGGTAFAKLLLGEASPSGHLPISWEAKLADNPSFAHYYPDAGTERVVYREGIFMGYRGYDHNGVKPVYPFGFGLSYTTFRFAHLQAEPAGPGAFHVSFDVTNTGSRAGSTAAQLYVSEGKPAVPRPEKELKAFARVMLEPNRTQHVVLELTPRSFTHFDTAQKLWRADAGEYTLRLGDSSASLSEHITVTLPAPLDVPVSQ